MSNQGTRSGAYVKDLRTFGQSSAFGDFSCAGENFFRYGLQKNPDTRSEILSLRVCVDLLVVPGVCQLVPSLNAKRRL